jgi:hypothetical protein
MKSLKFICATLILFSLTRIPFAFASQGSVVVTNNTNYTMTEFYASPSDASSWSTTSNLFSGQSLAPGQQTTISIDTTSGGCTYDLMAVLYGAAQYAYTYQVNVCSGGAWSISAN